MKKMVVILGVFLAVALCCFVSVPAYSQVTGATLSGTVTDASGAVIPNAQVSIRSLATGALRDITADSSGYYTAPNLAPGDYEIKVSAKGFTTAVVSNQSLAVGAQQTLNIPMKVGETSQTVQVTESAPQIDLTSSTLTGQVESETVRELPLNGRDWTSLATLQPGVNKIENQMSYDTSARGNRGFGSELTVSGQRSTFNNYRIDGISVVDYANAAPGNVVGVVLGVDSIQQFSVLTGGFDAEYGRATGGVVNAISKSGTNAFHGDAYEFLRNSALDANDYFTKSAGNPRPQFRRNQFGVSAGGPIIKDKTFIFGDYEGLRQAKGIPSTVTVPSDAARATATNAYSQRLLALYPHANGSTTDPRVGTFTYAANQVVPENFYTARVDQKIGSKDNLFGTYLFDDTDYTQPDKMGDVVTNSHTRRQTIAIEENHIFSSNFVNAVRIGYNRDHVINAFPVGALNPAASDVTLGYTLNQTAPRLSVTGIADMFGGVGANSHYIHTWNSYQLYDDAFWTHGAHTIKFGVSAEWIRYNFLTFQEPGARVKFASLTNFLNGTMKAFEAGLPSTVSPRQFQETIFGTYVQDDWRVRSNLTLNIGLRYEMTTVLKDGLGKIGSLQNIVEPNPNSTVDANLRCQAQTVAPVPPQPGTTCNSVGPYFSNPTLLNLEPRLGFAWDPFHNGKTSVRGGAGMYDVLPLPGYFILQQNQAAPYFIFKSINSPAALTGDWIANASPTVSFGNNLLTNSTASRLSASTIEPNPHRSYVMEWNLNVQRQIMPDLTLTLGYVGSHGVHLLQRGDDGNMEFAKLTPAGYQFGGPQINQALGVIRYIYWGTDSHYNGLNVNLQKAFGHGFQAQFSYTYSKSIDDDSQSIAGDTFANALNSPIWFLPQLTRGPSDFDVTHSISINGLWDVPGPKSGMGKTLLGGWELGTIVKVNSGVPTTPIIGGDPLGLGNSGADTFGLPNRVPGCDPINHGYANSQAGQPLWINSSCYTLPTVSVAQAATMPFPCTGFSGAPAPPAGQVYCSNLLGNSSRNSIYGPRLFGLDFSILKNFPIKSISETFNVQFRTEMFNLTNHDNFVPPQPGSGDGNSQIFNEDGSKHAGVISLLATDPREIQFALKIVW